MEHKKITFMSVFRTKNKNNKTSNFERIEGGEEK